MSKVVSLQCLRCGTHYTPDYRGLGCEACTGELASNLRVQYDADDVRAWAFNTGEHRRIGGLWQFADMLPVDRDCAVSLGEGGTPLVATERLAAYLGIENLYVKDETRNPTQSYKDRVSTVAVSYAKQLGAPVVATASSGNAGASLAAYAARAGMPCVVVSMKGAAGPMMTQIRKLGAHLIMMADKSQRWPLLAAGVRRHNWFVTSPYSAPVVGSTPIGIEGYKTIAYEIVQDLGRAPDWMAMPVCYGDALSGIYQGFMDLKSAGVIQSIPRFVAAEAHGSLKQALDNGSDTVPAATVKYDALAASVGAAQSAFQALYALRQSNGVAVPVNNDGLVEMQEQIASQEGLLLELASVMPFIAVRRLREAGLISAKELVVCLATGSGLKDVDKSTAAWSDIPVTTLGIDEILEATVEALHRRSSEVRVATLESVQ